MVSHILVTSLNLCIQKASAIHPDTSGWHFSSRFWRHETIWKLLPPLHLKLQKRSHGYFFLDSAPSTGKLKKTSSNSQGAWDWFTINFLKSQKCASHKFAPKNRLIQCYTKQFQHFSQPPQVHHQQQLGDSFKQLPLRTWPNSIMKALGVAVGLLFFQPDGDGDRWMQKSKWRTNKHGLLCPKYVYYIFTLYLHII